MIFKGVTAAILALLLFRYRLALMFGTVIGIFCFTCNANRDLILVLGRLGLSISYSTILATLHTLAADSDLRLRAWGAATQTTEPAFLLVFDNVNKMQRAWQQTVGHKDEVKSGTAATLIRLEDVPPGAMKAKPLLENMRKKERGNLTVQKLLDDIDWDHIEGIGTATVLRIWAKHISALSHFRADIESLFSDKHARHPIRLRKSDIHTMRSTNIDEATTAGMANVLQNLVLGQLHILKAWASWLILVCGDQLTIDRIRKLKQYTAKTSTPYERHDWALPIIQLWHMKWNWQKAIFRLHWWPDAGKNIFGLHHDCQVLERDKFNPTKCDFYPAHHILEDRFETFILDALRYDGIPAFAGPPINCYSSLICEAHTHVTKSPRTKLLEGLQQYFEAGGPLEDCSFDQLSSFAITVYQRYMCTSAYEDALGHSPRDPKVYGLPSSSDADVLHGELYFQAHGFVPNAESDLKSSAQNIALTGKPSKRPKKAAAAPIRNFSQGDQSLATTVNFIRTTFWYIEMCAATAEGDIGRVFAIIKVILLVASLSGLLLIAQL